MSDPASTARTARESLARGLAALQSDPNVPPALLELAAPIAQSMGALHQIERSNGAQLLPHANIALENVRAALSKLQSQGSAHPAVNAAMEAVASSLGLVHALSQLAGPQAPRPAAPVAAPAPAPAPAPQPVAAPQAFAPQGFQPAQHAAPMAQTMAAPVAQPMQPQGGFAPAQPMQPQGGFAPAQPMQPQGGFAPAQPMQPQGGFAPAQPMQPQGGFAPAQPMQPQGGFAPAPAQAFGGAPAGMGVSRDPFAAGAPAPSPGGAGDKLVVPADLGAQSPTNFYKGLSGNDIVDHGGLFVSTYMIPKIGTQIRLKVALPGGYEFEADAVVRWARDVRDASSDAPPGFGAQFTNITSEARQLIYRYVRNREPLFHDDL